MSLTDRLGDTYIAALQHDLVEVPPAATLVGVVRRPTGWFNAAVDENIRALGPPAALLDAVKQQNKDFKMQGLCDEGAHNAAWEATDFYDQYYSHLRSDTAANTAVRRLRDRLSDGEHLILVCFENTKKKRCHRTLIREYITEQQEDAP
ncbi:DUF488 family protein, N3 subclade [Halocatena halophila]|uniref:DUF488 family protein, N3 subclade n=1 Tax=Halocatena halophila TaxID=2814576 RepID=UPI002ED32EA5